MSYLFSRVIMDEQLWTKQLKDNVQVNILHSVSVCVSGRSIFYVKDQFIWVQLVHLRQNPIFKRRESINDKLRAKGFLEVNANDFLTRQSLWQVYIVVVYREVNFFLGGAQQTLICENGHSSVDVVMAGCGMLLDEHQVTHHHSLRLRLKVILSEEKNRRVHVRPS